MIQALIATIVELVSLFFALGAGGFLEESKAKGNDKRLTYKGVFCLVMSMLLGMCTLGVAAR